MEWFHWTTIKQLVHHWLIMKSYFWYPQQTPWYNHKPITILMTSCWTNQNSPFNRYLSITLHWLSLRLFCKCECDKIDDILSSDHLFYLWSSNSWRWMIKAWKCYITQWRTGPSGHRNALVAARRIPSPICCKIVYNSKNRRPTWQQPTLWTGGSPSRCTKHCNS